LADFYIEGMTDLTAYFPFIENQPVALDATNRYLFVSTPYHKKLHVIDTETMNIIHTINDIPISRLIRSHHGPLLIGISPASSDVKFINTETYEVTEKNYGDLGFGFIQESKTNPDIWYIVVQGTTDFGIGIYNHETKSWVYRASFPIANGHPTDLKVLPNEERIYVAVFGGWYPEPHAYGSVYVVDLVQENYHAFTVDGGAGCLETSSDNQHLYVGTGWPLPNNNNILAIDTQTEDIVGSVTVRPHPNGAPYTQMNALQLDPSNSNILYATSGDGNALIKVKLDTLMGYDVLIFNVANYMPRNFARYSGKSIGYFITNVPYLFEFNKVTANIDRVFRLPPIRAGMGWDMKITNDDKAYISQGEYFLKMDMNSLNIIGNYLLPPELTNVTSIWGFTLSQDNNRIYTIGGDISNPLESNFFTAVDTSNFQIAARYKLDGGDQFASRFVLPDSSKFYAIGGVTNGDKIIIHVIRTDNLTIEKTITSEQAQGSGAGPSSGLAYDPVSHTLYVGGMKTILVIDTTTDTIKKVISLANLAIDNGYDPNLFPYINAGKLIYNPVENYLYIFHQDNLYISIYDLSNNRFLPTIIHIKGIGTNDFFSNDDYSKIFAVNGWSDNISVIDVASKSLERLIDLHDYLEIHKIYLPLILN
jgi:hypothetical protein